VALQSQRLPQDYRERPRVFFVARLAGFQGSKATRGTRRTPPSGTEEEDHQDSNKSDEEEGHNKEGRKESYQEGEGRQKTMTKTKRVAIYARVSTTDQSTEPQLLDLRRYVSDRGWEIFKEYVDEGISGTRDSRPALNEMMKDATKRRFKVVLVWHFDRFARSTQHLINALEEFNALGLDFISLSESIDTSTPMGKMVYTVIAAVAELERSLISERVKAGLRRAKQNGKQLGRPRGCGIDTELAQELREQGLTMERIAAEMSTSPATVCRALMNGGA